MPSLNKVLLMGNLTRNPELRYTPGGSAVCEIGLAVNRKIRDNAGNERDEPCFVDVVVWNKSAEACSRYLQKGSPLFVEGRLSFEQWEDKSTGTKRSRIRVTAEHIQFLSGGEQKAQDGQEAESAPPLMPSQKAEQSRPKEEHRYSQQDRQPETPGEKLDNADDDIPF